MPPDDKGVVLETLQKKKTRREFMKIGAVGAAGAAVVGLSSGLIGKILNSSELTTKEKKELLKALAVAQGYPQYGSYLVYYDAVAATFKGMTLGDGSTGYTNTDAGAIVKSIAQAAPTSGAVCWLSDDVNEDGTAGHNTVVTITKNNVSLVAMKKNISRNVDVPRPRLFCVEYDGAIKGGLLQGFQANEIRFLGTGDQKHQVLRDISMHVDYGQANWQGLRFLGAGSFYQRNLVIENLEMTLYGASPIGIDFANASTSTEDVDFTGHTIIEVDSAVSSSPIGVRFAAGFKNGGPIRFDNLSIIEGVRTLGSPIRPFQQEAQAGGAGVRNLSLGRFYFEQHAINAAQTFHYLFTIKQGTSSPLYFNVRIGQLSVQPVSTNPASAVRILDNQNSTLFWPSSEEQFVHIVSGNAQLGGIEVGNTLQCWTANRFRLHLGRIIPLTPFGQLDGTSGRPYPFINTPDFVLGAGGNSVTPTANQQYLVSPTPIFLNGTGGVTVTVYDPAGNLVRAVLNPSGLYVPVGYRLQFSSGSGISIWGA